MSDTPQNDDVIIEEDNAVIETNDSVLESDTSSQVQDESIEQVDEVAVAQEKANAAFNKQYGEKKQLERDLAAQAEKLAQFEQAERERQAAAVGNIPPMPDAFDDDFDVKVKQRDEAIIAQANYNAANNAYLEQQQFNQQQAAQAKQQEAAKLQNDFVTKARGIGATDEEFNGVINTLNNSGMTADTASGIMALGADGYLVAKLLAASPQEAHGFNSLNLMQQGAKLVELKQKASALKPKTSNAPSPATNLQGNGAGDQKHPALNGVTYT